jgi:ERCC4-type nuclease
MLIIDTREGKLIELIKNTSSFTLPYEVKNLQIGDIIISSNKYPEKTLIIERKCMTDMICSIKDGRYKEQKLRLQAEVANSKTEGNTNTRICYLIEGIINDLRLPHDKTLLYGSIVSSIFRDNIPLIRTNSLNETLDIITRIHERMNKDITDFFKAANNTLDTQSNLNLTSNINTTPDITLHSNDDNNGVDNTTNDDTNNNLYLQSIKKCKKENLTSKVWNQIALTNIPGISTNIAIKINEKYPTIRKLLEAYTICSNDDERIKLISEIILTDTDKQKRRIGPVIAKRIFEYLYLDTD